LLYFLGVKLKKLMLALVVLLSGCTSTNNESTKIITAEKFEPKAWVEINSKTSWFDLMLNTQSQSKVKILTSKFTITNPIRSNDGELLAYISYENKQIPTLYLQNIYSAKRKKFEEYIDKSSTIEFSPNEKSIILKTGNSSKLIPISSVIIEI